MKNFGNCRISGPNGSTCPFLRFPAFHSGYTSKSGPETWFSCKRLHQHIRNIKVCELSGDSQKQHEAYQLHLEQEREAAKKEANV